MTQVQGDSPKPHAYLDHKLRIVELSLEPALTLARAMALPLDDVLALTESVYFRLHQQRGLSFTAIAQRLGKSRRTIATLAQKAKGRGETESDQLTLRRLVLQKLAAHGPSTLAELKRRSPGRKLDALKEALDTLQASAMVQQADGRYRVATSTFSLLGQDWEQRQASLQQFLQAVTDVVYQRFFALDGASSAFARVLSFRSTAARLKALGEEHYTALRQQVVDADAEQERRDRDGAEDGRNVSVALFFAEEPTAPPLRR